MGTRRSRRDRRFRPVLDVLSARIVPSTMMAIAEDIACPDSQESEIIIADDDPMVSDPVTTGPGGPEIIIADDDPMVSDPVTTA